VLFNHTTILLASIMLMVPFLGDGSLFDDDG
jgi:hypothetical protein